MAHKITQLDIDEAEARKLGLSYGVYIGYKETGYLDTYISSRKTETEKANIIPSNIVGRTKSPRRAFFKAEVL